MARGDFDGFAVFDVETTGLFAGMHHRIIEIGVVRLDEDFDVIESWETLINPGRDLGPTDIHGIAAADVRDAPTFQELIADVWHRFEGAVPVAHNFGFDRKFIVAEFARAGVDLDDFDGICTLRLTDQFDVAGGFRKLVDICRYLSLPTEDAHSAGHDARMCAEVLKRVAEMTDVCSLGRPVTCSALWCMEATPLGITRQKAREAPIESPLQEAASRLSSKRFTGNIDSGTVSEYLALLDRVLEDRVITSEEAESLVEFAGANGLDADQVAEIHRTYLAELAEIVRSDGVVTADERRDMQRAAGLLGIDQKDMERMLAASPASVAEIPTEDLTGKTVCFSGTSTCKIDGEKVTKDLAKKLAEQAGLVPTPSVTKALDILVVADPDSPSAKATKARKYGTRIIAERAFWLKLNILVD